MGRMFEQTIAMRAPHMLIAGLIGAMGLTAVPTEARDHRNDNRRDWRDDRRDDRRYDRRDDRRDNRAAYQQGYRDGRQQSARQQNWGYQQPARVYVPARQVQPVYVNNRYPVYANHPGTSRGWVQGRDYWYSNGRYQCRRSDGTTGVVVGAVAGGTLGNILAGQGDKTLGSIIGGTLGAIIGKEIEKGEARCR